METVPQTLSAVIANAEKICLHVCKRQAFVLHKNQPLEFLSLARQEAVTAKRASRVLQVSRQLEGASEKADPASRLLDARSEQGTEPGARPNCRDANPVPPGRVVLGKSHPFSELQVHPL